MRESYLDDDAVVACADLVRRTGARTFEVGFVHDDVPTEEAGWYAHAGYPGTRLTVEDLPGPVEACDALARKLLTGARCTGCQGLVTLTSAGATAYPGVLSDGTRWTAQEIMAAPQCRWRRMGDKWVMGCQSQRSAPSPGRRRR